MNPPKRMNIKLSKSDIKKDMRHTLEVMSKIRKDSLINDRYSSEQKEVYLHYAYNLSSQINALMDDQMFNKLRPLTEKLSFNSLFSVYDPLQTYWAGRIHSFVSDLEYAALSVFREGFCEVDHMYHLLQAVKYIGTQESLPEERRDFHSTILPFQNPLRRDLSLSSKGHLRETKEYRLMDNSSEPLVLNVNVSADCKKDSLPFYIVDLAKERGYAKIRMSISGSQWVSSKHDFNLHGFKPVSVNESATNMPLPVNMTVEARINPGNSLEKKILNPIGYFEAAAKISIPEIIYPESFAELSIRKKNMITRIGNPPIGVVFNTYLENPNNFLYFSHSLAVSGFNKIQEFYWTTQGRYLTCVISSRPSPIKVVKPINPIPLHKSIQEGSPSTERGFSMYHPRILSQPATMKETILSYKTSKEKLLQICEGPDVKYAHLRHFIEGVLIDDLEGFN